MKRFALYGMLFVLLAVLIYAGWRGAAWLAGTEDGARWVLDCVSRHTTLKISARKIEGTLREGLRLSDVHLTLKPFEMDMERMDYHWRPLRLFSGTVAIENLNLTGVRIEDKSAERRPPDLTWPKISGIASLFDVFIKKLTIEDVSYIVPSRNLSVTDMSFNGSVLWRHGKLTVSDMIFLSPYGRVKGEIEAGFYQPTLWVDLHVASQRHFAKMDIFSVQGRFKPGYRPELIAGDFNVSGSSGSLKLFDLKGKAGMTASAFHLRDLRLDRPGRGGSITGEGNVTLTVQEPLLSFKLLLNGVDLAEELKMPVTMDGVMTLRGTPSCYDGDFTIENSGKGWQKATFAGNYSGGGATVKTDNLTASLLSGTVQGALSLDWQKEFLVKGLLRGKNINPADFDAGLVGIVNFDLAGDLKWAAGGALSGRVNGKLLKSRLQGQLLTGEVNAGFHDGRIYIEKLALKGSGFDGKASGILGEKLTFGVRISDMGRLLSGAAGAFSAGGWVRFSEGKLSGSATGHGNKISIHDVKIGAAELNGFIGTQKDASVRIHAGLRGVSYKKFLVDSASVEMKGTVSRHEIDMALKMKKAEMQLSLSGGLRSRLWQGYIERFSGRDEIGPWKMLQRAPVAASMGEIAISKLVLEGEKSERLEIGGTLTEEPRRGFFTAKWARVNIKRLTDLFPEDVHGAGFISGNIEGKTLPDGNVNLKGQISVAAGELSWHRKTASLDMLIPAAELSWSSVEKINRPTAFRLTGRADVNGSVTTEGDRITLQQGSLRVEGGEEGISAEAELSPKGGGLFKAGFSSVAPLVFALPETGEFNARWTDVHSDLFRFLLPETFKMEGRLAGKAKGNLVSGRRFFLSGETVLTPPAGAGEGKISLLKKNGEMNVNFRSASLAWDWKEKTLNGDVSLSLGDFGRLRGSFRLPIPASFPVSIDKKGPLYVSFNGKLKENGLLAYLFPGAVKESRGEIDADVVVEGSWENPLSKGRMELAKAGAYLPVAGIDVKDVQISLVLENDLVRIDSFQAESGPGKIYGNAVIRFDNRRVSEFEGSVKGNDFQLVYLPELQVRAAPDLTFRGTPKTLTLRGEVKLPELLIFGPPAGNFVAPSSDVVLEGQPRNDGKTFLPAFDAKVRLTLGDRSLVKMEGIDAKLAGSIDLDFQRLDKIASKGEIRTVSGSYNVYGIDLQISRGRLFYTGGAINQPALDILALRSAGDVKAGVTIGGILSTPVIKLYSEPVMSDVDILSYIVFGHPVSNRSSAEQISTLTQTAGFLLTRGKTASFQENLRKKLGLSTLDIQSMDSGLAGSTGYKKVNGNRTPTGATSNRSADVSETLVAVGKYLTPQLYLSYGRSLFTGNNIFSLRYDIGKKWQIETVTGTESGIDLYYKIDFK